MPRSSSRSQFVSRVSARRTAESKDWPLATISFRRLANSMSLDVGFSIVSSETIDSKRGKSRYGTSFRGMLNGRKAFALGRCEDGVDGSLKIKPRVEATSTWRKTEAKSTKKILL